MSNSSSCSTGMFYFQIFPGNKFTNDFVLVWIIGKFARIQWEISHMVETAVFEHRFNMTMIGCFFVFNAKVEGRLTSQHFSPPFCQLMSFHNDTFIFIGIAAPNRANLSRNRACVLHFLRYMLLAQFSSLSLNLLALLPLRQSKFRCLRNQPTKKLMLLKPLLDVLWQQ